MRALSPELARADLVSPVVAWLQPVGMAMRVLAMGPGFLSPELASMQYVADL